MRHGHKHITKLDWINEVIINTYQSKKNGTKWQLWVNDLNPKHQQRERDTDTERKLKRQSKMSLSAFTGVALLLSLMVCRQI